MLESSHTHITLVNVTRGDCYGVLFLSTCKNVHYSVIDNSLLLTLTSEWPILMRYNELWLRMFVPTHGMCSAPSTGGALQKSGGAQ